jgi:UDP-GlcNAc:undecaprenyl-phosphate GlcNAc-1-phosphate transferase
MISSILNFPFIIFFVLSIFIYYLIYNNRTRIALFFNVNDIPDEKRKIHKLPTPKTACYPAAITLFFLLILNLNYDFFKKDFNFIILITLLFFLVGFFDDKYKLSAYKKIFFISVLCMFFTSLSNNFVINKFYVATLDTYFYLNNFSILFTVMCILGLTNALNLVDGINGLATGLIFFWLLYVTQVFKSDLNLIIYFLSIHLILIFFHNYKGKHFIGDAGSLMLSSFLAIILIKLYNEKVESPSPINSSEQILIYFIIPILDMVRLFFERIHKKKDPLIADNNHLHHYLLKKNSLKKTLVIYLLLVNIPIIISLITLISKIYIITTVILIYIIFIKYLRPNYGK